MKVLNSFILICVILYCVDCFHSGIFIYFFLHDELDCDLIRRYRIIMMCFK